ncbi:hypothetical protein BdWA1_000916 [Babesia duncani]|uniref:Uncharacterized protein n=1 Tax=Babesia duncani TaxID=323732 RepID=A0AAD9PNA2_9APIC|nr:hypothetical protein BdWA1_000916 [Babesia duncani]
MHAMKSPGIDAIGVWDGRVTSIIQHRGYTMHKLALNRNEMKLTLNTQETLFALFRCKFLLIDLQTRGIVGPREILERLDLNELLKVHAYLALKRAGKQVLALDTSYYQEFQSPPNYIWDLLPSLKYNYELVQPSQLLHAFVSQTRQIPRSLKCEMNEPVYKVDGSLVYVTTPDSLCMQILSSLSNHEQDHSKAVVAISNLDSAYIFDIGIP